MSKRQIPPGLKPICCVDCGTTSNIRLSTRPVRPDGSALVEIRRKGLCVTHARKFDLADRSEEECDFKAQQYLKKAKTWAQKSDRNPCALSRPELG